MECSVCHNLYLVDGKHPKLLVKVKELAFDPFENAKKIHKAVGSCLPNQDVLLQGFELFSGAFITLNVAVVTGEVFVLVLGGAGVLLDQFLYEFCDDLKLLQQGGFFLVDIGGIGEEPCDHFAVGDYLVLCIKEDVEGEDESSLDVLFGKVDGFAFVFAFELVVALPYGSAVFAVAVPYL